MVRKHIAFIFNYDEGWIGGAYYILNIIQALKSLEENQRPFITVLTSERKDYLIAKKETGYPYIRYKRFPRKIQWWKKSLNSKYRIVTGKNIITDNVCLPEVDFVYPSFHPQLTCNNLKKVYWIPDFQEEYLPELFSEKVIANRRKRKGWIAENADGIVFSSRNAQSHFVSAYPDSNARQHVLPFAVSHPSLDSHDIKGILDKHKLPERYFFAPNQFWAHKNQIVILKAAKILIDKGVEVFVAFSGKEYDHRAPGYFKELVEFVKGNKLQDNVRFLGFIDREEQLIILRNSVAVIQPSLFEGWSTVVEDSKAQGKHLILSSLDVHYEQMDGWNANFFEPHDFVGLSDKMQSCMDNPSELNRENDYALNIKRFGEQFLEIVALYSS